MHQSDTTRIGWETLRTGLGDIRLGDRHVGFECESLVNDVYLVAIGGQPAV